MYAHCLHKGGVSAIPKLSCKVLGILLIPLSQSLAAALYLCQCPHNTRKLKLWSLTVFAFLALECAAMPFNMPPPASASVLKSSTDLDIEQIIHVLLQN